MPECRMEHDDVLVLGGVVDAFLQAFGAYRSRGVRVLARHFAIEELTLGLEQLYPVHKLLAGMKELQEQFGQGFMTRIGQSIFERAVFPPNLDSFGTALAALDTAYYMNHQNAEGKIGHYSWQGERAARGRMVCDNPYPCSFDLGIFAGMAVKFGVTANVTHLEPELCRHVAGDRCTYLIEW